MLESLLWPFNLSMPIYEFYDQTEIDYLREAGPPSMLWQQVVQNMKCETHQRSAGFTFGMKQIVDSGDEMRPFGSIDACCQEFADICFDRLRRAVDGKRNFKPLN